MLTQIKDHGLSSKRGYRPAPGATQMVYVSRMAYPTDGIYPLYNQLFHNRKKKRRQSTGVLLALICVAIQEEIKAWFPAKLKPGVIL